MRAFLGLGSNVGDRLANLRAAHKELQNRGLAITATSSVYETEPQGEITDQPEFLNACLAVATQLEPEALLELCKSAEQAMGRAARGPRHGPRPIDIDLLLMDGIELRSERLTLPHRDIGNRRFVIVPLLELDPELALPGGARIVELLERLEGQRVERIAAL